MKKGDKIKKAEIKYSNDDINIVWRPNLCTHSGFCVRLLPNVYKPKERPWITIENATTQDFKRQINKCPSKALTYEEI